MIHFIQPGRRARREIRIPAAASRGQIRARPVSPGHHPAHVLGRVLRHHGQAGLREHQAGDERRVSGKSLERAWRLRETVGTAGLEVVVLVLRGDDVGAVIQWERRMRSALTTQSRRAFAQTAVNAVGVTQIRHGRLVCEEKQK